MSKDFDQFQKFGKEQFEKFFSENRALRFNKLYKEKIAPRGRDGGVDNHLFDVFWGYRPYDKKMILFNDDGSILTPPKSVILSEMGVMLHYQEIADGRVFVYLFPAEADELKYSFDFIIIDKLCCAKKLLNVSVLRKHWNRMLLFMENTSLTGNASWFSKIKMWVCLHCYPYSEDGKQKESKFRRGVKKFCSVVFPIAFSGFGIFLLQYCTNSDVREQNEKMLKKDSLLINHVSEIKRNMNMEIEELKEMNIWLYGIQSIDDDILQVDRTQKNILTEMKKNSKRIKNQIKSCCSCEMSNQIGD